MKETILGIIRHGLTAAGGALTSKGIADAGEIELLVGSIVTIVGVVWSIVSKRKKKEESGNT